MDENMMFKEVLRQLKHITNPIITIKMSKGPLSVWNTRLKPYRKTSKYSQIDGQDA